MAQRNLFPNYFTNTMRAQVVLPDNCQIKYPDSIESTGIRSFVPFTAVTDILHL